MSVRLVSRTAVFLFLVTASLLPGGDAEAQHRPEPLIVSAWTPPSIGGTVPQDASPSFERILLGSALGTVAGAAAGTGVALLVATARPGEAYAGPLPELLFLGLPIMAAGMTRGTYVGAGRQVSPWIAGAASVAGMGLGLGAGILMGEALGPSSGENVSPAVGAVAVGVVVGITVPAAIVWATTR